MLTGRYMHVLGHRTQTHLIQDYEMNYYRAMKEAGYYTAMSVVLEYRSGGSSWFFRDCPN